ncbi:ecdysteroid 22-kinase family protein [Sphingobium sp. Sx8-8]|uniref:ecdysteroid 22-kinase family protein n=1 Tax=Sphingobium sp. Sx8-8 TaxID=2933617 RepID=UPI001F5907DF|nr:ecdysteroid 22-kinase family protein [Sphingobium sp. Sx8-8]
MAVNIPDPAPITTMGVLDPDWLTRTVYAAWPGVTVEEVEVVETLATTATKIRIRTRLRGADATVPTALCIKAMLDDLGEQFRGSAISINEAAFYRDIAAPLASAGLRTPPCLYIGIDPATSHGLIVMEDLVEAGGHFLSALTPYSPQDARASLDQLARLHGATWQTQAPFDAPWVTHAIDAIAEKSMIPLDMLQDLMNGERGKPLPPAVLDAQRLHRAIGRVAAVFRTLPSSLVHGDAHAGNLYVLRGDTGLIDWQLLQRGCWALDVAYHLGAALLPEVRRAHERSLLDHYLERLARFGGPRLDAGEAWTSYRMAMLYGYYLWAITRRVDPVITYEFNRRLGLAVADLQSLELAES